MSNLYIITGPAGVGKSTISKKVAINKEKSVLIEGDDIYHQVIGGYVPAWKQGNHLNIFWKICINTIDTYLKAGYDVIFNYIIPPISFNVLREKFKNYNIKFVVLLVDEKTIIERDNCRPTDCQMHERCIALLDNFKKYDFGKDYSLDTSNLSIDETIKIIETREKFNV